jgi:hypothetical protein
MRLLIPLVMLLLITGCNRITETVVPDKPAQEKAADTQYSKDIEEIRKGLKGDIRLKLKKDAKGGYSWEITGKDIQEVLKANDAFRKKLSD